MASGRPDVVQRAFHVEIIAHQPVAGELDDGEPGRFGAAGGQDLALVPLEAPQRRADAIRAWIDGDEFDEIRMKRLVLMTKQADAAAVAERALALVGALIDARVS